jgi:hypothetical protein
MHKETISPHVHGSSKTNLCYFKILQSLSINPRERLAATSCSKSLKSKMEVRARWTNEREMGQKSGSITIAQEMVKK